jgi:hypothetical protein
VGQVLGGRRRSRGVVFERIQRLVSNNETRAKILLWFWLISLVVLLVGFGVIAWRFLGGR